MAFWVVLTVLAGAAAIATAWPLLAAEPAEPTADADDDRARRLAVYRDRRREIELERDAGRLSADEAARALDELVDEVAEVFDPPDPQSALPASSEAPVSTSRATSDASAPRAPARRRSAHWLAAMLVVLAIPLIAVPVYRHVGTPEARVVVQRDAPASADEQEAQLREMVAELERRTAERPADGEAWVMLAQARRLLGDPASALLAYERANELIGSNARLLADFAETAAVAAGGDFVGRPTELLRQALAVDPAEPKANGLMGAVLYRGGQLEAAERHLRVLLAAIAPGTEQARSVEAVLERIAARRAAEAGAARPADTAPGSAVAQSRSGAPTGALSGTVEIDADLAQRVPPGAVLYVYARAADGPRMPYAVLRVPAARLPLAFELSDAQAMSPDRRLSSASAVVVEARLSASGNASPTPGDLVGTTDPVRPGTGGLVVRISRILP